MRSWKPVTAAVAATAAVLLLLIFLLPLIVRDQVQKLVAEKTGRTLVLEGLSFNPLTLAVEVRGFSLSERGEATPFVTFDRLRLNLKARSMVERALITDELRLEGLRVHLVRLAPNRFNFSDLLERPPAPEDTSAEPKEPFHFFLNNITVTGAGIDFDDQGITPARHHTVRDLELAIPFLGNVPYVVDSYVTPLLSATVNGTPFRVEGEMKPFADTVEVSTTVRLDRLDLPVYLGYLPAPLPVTVDSGSLSVDLQLVYRASREARPEFTAAGTLSLAGLDLREADGGPLLRLPHFDLSLLPSRLLEGEAALARVAVHEPELNLSRNRQGEWNVLRLAGGRPEKEETAKEEGESGAPPRVTIGAFRLAGGQLHFRDEQPPGGFGTELREITLDLDDFSTEAGHTFPFALALQSGREEHLSARGDLVLSPMTANAEVDLRSLPLAAYHPYLASFLTRPLAGTLAARARVALTAEGTLRVTGGALEFRDLAAPFGGAEGMRLKRLALDGIAVDTGARQAEVGQVGLEGGRLRFSRSLDGSWSPLTLFPPAPPAGAPPENPESSVAPFAWRIGRITAAGVQASFTDGALPTRPEFALRDLRLDLTDLRSPGPSFTAVQLSAAFGRQGAVTLRGKGGVEPLAFAGEATVKRFPLSPFAPYLPERFRFELVDGDLDARLSLAIGEAGEKVSGKVEGDVGIRRFEIVDAETGDDLLRWESLQVDDLRADLEPFSLRIGSIALNDFLARLIILPDATLNLQRAFGGGEAPPSGSGPEPGAPAPSPPAPPYIAIDAVTVQNGTIDFTDRHMRPAFRTTMFNLGGRVAALASDSTRPAELDLRGNLENQSPLSIVGSVDPLGKDLFADLKIRFSDIELSPVTPYSARYLGYVVEKGKLFLDLDYHIEGGKLESSNRVFLDQFTFGEKVESEEATSLPVRLAVDLLKDRKGEIHLDLPVRGTLDDPEFSVWGVVLKILKNLLVKAATSPMALLTSLTGGGEEFNAISFPPGSIRLPDSDREALRRLADALRDRPALKLEIMGFADREHDPEGLRQEVLREKLRREKYLELAQRGQLPPGTTAEQVDVSAGETPHYLGTVYRKAKFPKPRTFLGLAKTLPEEEMRKLILANIPAGEEELQALAWGRAAAVRAFLLEEGGLPPERIFQKKVDIYQPPARPDAGPSRVEFGVAAP